MNTNMSIRDLTRNGKKLSKFDYIDIEDKKSKEYKGVFVSKKYAKEVKAYLNKMLAKERKDHLEKLMEFAGIADGDTNNKSIQELKADKSKKYK
jgi:hypothetical protein